jgi:BirA family transcriptional regulator, biotin operon repressor / biotin---[acetyl-CoA-carboxylase] ligase
VRAPLQVRSVTDGLAAPWSGVTLVDETASTNTDLAAAARAGAAAPWSVLVTEHQSAGRGRLGRTWTSVRGATLTFSALVPVPATPGWTPLLAGLALADALEDLYAVRPALKWPNDVLGPAGGAHESRKLAGVLCELTPEGVVVGIGLNVDQDEGELPMGTATSLRLVSGGHPPGLSREGLLREVLTRLATLQTAVLCASSSDVESVMDAYRRSCTTIGREVAVDLGPAGVRHGRAVAVDPDGCLVLDLDGRREALSAGDVTHVR